MSARKTWPSEAGAEIFARMSAPCGPRRPRIDGPFTETKEVVAGYSIWTVKDMDEAMAWVARAPMSAPGKIEIRPLFYEMNNGVESMTAEWAAINADDPVALRPSTTGLGAAG